MAATIRPAAAFHRLHLLREGVGRGASAVFVIRVASAGFAYAAQVLAARLMGWDGYGIFATAWVWTALVGHSLTLGLSQGACRFLPEDQARGDADHVRGFLRAGALVTGGTALAAGGLGMALVLLEPGLLPAPYRIPVLIAAAILPVFAMQDYLEGIARSQNWLGLAIVPPYLLRQSAMMAFLVGAVLLGAPPVAGTAMACMFAAALVSTLLQARLVARRLRAAWPAGHRRYRWRHWFGTSLPIAGIDLATAAFGFVDVIVLGALVNPAELGLYFAATRIQQIAAFVQYAVSAAALQHYSAAQARGDRPGLVGLVRRQGRLTAGATALVGLGLLAASPLLLALFEAQASTGLPLLAVLVAGGVAASLFGPGADLLTMLGGEGICAAVTGTAVAVAAILCLILVPVLGPLGAALGMALTQVGRAAILSLAAGRLHRLSTPVWAAGAA
ncbi:lipopolysaccharide biosynthesis protein [Methylobacterium sp. J-076]|uniref:lipopolysaccharide biosynthesis protein n=1 Tax=Methylobacterium sp. J-076 TaxID=2836655 RepID=UPI001FBAE135|nr:lipopolysaccharide biosynthesis protein [Methylobacterium sp. J-076]MCJ2012873.1 lipopolysaccharide biosynthesis protein [Methylobacterium sp. J-076]